MARQRGWSDMPARAAVGNGDADGDDEPTQREKLISIGLDADLWHDRDGIHSPLSLWMVTKRASQSKAVRFVIG
jgi:hypothetical protein